MVMNKKDQKDLKGLKEIGFSSTNFFTLKAEIEFKSRLVRTLSVIWLTIIGSFIVGLLYIATGELGAAFSLLLLLYLYLIIETSIKTARKIFDTVGDLMKFIFLNTFIVGPFLLFLMLIGPLAIIFLPIPIFISTAINTGLLTGMVNRNPTGFVANILKAREPNLNDQKERLAYQLYDALRIGYGLPADKTQLKIVDWPIINAMAVSGSKGDNLIILTKGAVEKLEYHELENVLAHEFAHIANKDSELMTRFAIASGVALILAWYLAFYLPQILLGSGSSGRRKEGGGLVFLAIIAFIVGIIFYIATPFIMSKLASRASKLREYLADMTAVRKTNYPPGLISALVKVAYENSSEFIKKNRIPENIQALLFDTEIETHPRVWQRIYLICESTKAPLPPQFYELKEKNI